MPALASSEGVMAMIASQGIPSSSDSRLVLEAAPTSCVLPRRKRPPGSAVVGAVWVDEAPRLKP